MNESIFLDRALCLPAPEIEALEQGRMIIAMPRTFIDSGWLFALYPCDTSANVLPTDQHYHPNFVPVAQTALSQLCAETVVIKAWARCEVCEMLHEAESLEALSSLTIWTTEALQETLRQRQFIFLAYLHLYQLSQPIEVPGNLISREKIGKFVGLPNSLTISEFIPVLSDRLFAQRRHQLEKRLPPLHPELEKLQSAVAQLTEHNSAAEELNQDIKILLGWSNNLPLKQLDSDLNWIRKIAEIGNSSDGQTFEKLVRRSLFKLGYRGSGLAPDSTGGAGGMDFYCEFPYPMVGECKATKTESVSDGTPAQLLKIGINHLGKDQYERSIKLIVAAGNLNFYALRTATENEMNVIRPEILQRLVEMQAKYKNSINLLELKQCLQQAPFGLADDKVNSYIDGVCQKIKLRVHLIHLVKKQIENTGDENVGVDSLYGAYFYSNPPQPLKREEMHEILIELSSPLTGYLARIKGNDWMSDRFYFLRDLNVESDS